MLLDNSCFNFLLFLLFFVNCFRKCFLNKLFLYFFNDFLYFFLESIFIDFGIVLVNIVLCLLVLFLEYKNKLVFELDLELEFEEELEELELEEFEFEFELVDVLFFLCFLEFECVLIEILLDLFLLF